MINHSTENGYTLIETLVALSILALGIASAGAVLANTSQAQARATHHDAARTLISELYLDAAEDEGERVLGDNGPVASWMVQRRNIGSAMFAGRSADWIETTITVSWTWQNVERREQERRIEIIRPASP